MSLSLFFLFFFLFGISGLQTHNLGIPYDGIPVSSEKPNFFTRRHFEPLPESDGFTKLEYDIETIDNLINLKDVQGIVSLECTLDSLTVHFEKGTVQPVWKRGFTLVGSSSFGCRNDEGRAAPFYRVVESLISDRDTVHIQTKSIKALECFKYAKISFKHEPGTSSKRIDYFGPASGTSTATLFSWNYQSGSAKQVLPIWQAGGQVGPGTYEVDVKCSNCYATLSAGISWDLYINSNWGFPHCEHFKIVVSGNAEVNVDVTVSGSYSFNLAKELTILGETDIGSIEIPVGTVPVEITAAIELDSKAEISFGSSGSASAGFSYQKTLSAGLEYKADWGEFRQVPPTSTQTTQIHTPSYSVEANSDVKVTLAPKLLLKLYDTIPFFLKLEPYIGSKLAIGSGSGCSSMSAIHYQLYYGLNLDVGLDPIHFSLFGFADIKLGKSVGLPIDRDFTVVPETDFSCSSCSGCISLNKRTPSYYWSKSEWSACSTPCGGGTKTRTVQCVFENSTVSDSSCSHVPKPSTEMECNSQECTSTICQALSDCDACIDNILCGWCLDTQSCQALDSSCSGNLTLFQCPTKESPISISYPTEGFSFSDLDSVHLNWTGGNDHVFIVFTWDTDLGWFAAGSSSNHLANTGVYNFDLPDGIPESNEYQFAIVSSTDTKNHAIIKGITIQRQSSTSYVPLYSQWSACSENCGVGTQTRVKTCYNHIGEQVEDSLCTAAQNSLSETHTRPCRTKFACKHFPIKLRNIKLGQQFLMGKIHELRWSGGKEDDKLQIDIQKVGSNDWKPIAPSTENDDSYEWEIPSDVGEGLFQLRITSQTLETNQYISQQFLIESEQTKSSSTTLFVPSIVLILSLLVFNL